jgi:hypothetical protein
MRRIFFSLIFMFVYLSLSHAVFSKDDVGTSTAQFLKLGAGARATGMGDAFVGISDDATAVYWNPAGLNQVDRESISIMHAIWFEDIFYDWVSYALPMSIGTVGLGLQYLSYGSMEERDTSGLEISSFKPSDLAGTISYARKISNIMLGINVKYISSRIKQTATAFAIDMGVLYKLSGDKVSLGCVIQNVGTKMKFVEEENPLPMNIKIGSCYNIKENWLTAVDFNLPNDNILNVEVGTEYNYLVSEKTIISGRAGYNTKSKDIDGLKGITVGLGGSYLDYNLDYAFVPFGDLGNTHRVSFGIKF